MADEPPPHLVARVKSAVALGCLVHAPLLVTSHTASAAAAMGTTGNAAGSAASGTVAAAKAVSASSIGAGAATVKTVSTAVLLKPLLLGALGGGLVCGSAATLQSLAKSHEPARASAPSTTTTHITEERRPTQQRVATGLAASKEGELVADAAPEPLAVAAQRHPNAREAQGLDMAATLDPTHAAATEPSLSAGSASIRRGARALGTKQLHNTTPAVAPSAAPLRIEIEQIDRVRQALAAHEPRKAEALLDQYDASAPLHVFAGEALELRIDSALARGDHALACRLAARYLRNSAQGSQAARLRQLRCSQR